MIVTKKTYKLPCKVKEPKKRPTLARPNQTLSVEEIVRRYTRGLPLGVKESEAVYYPPENGLDMEKLSRMDFDDKAAYAAEMRAVAKRYEKAKAEQDAQRQAEELEAIVADKREPSEQRGRGVLDNTLPHDSESTELSKNKVSKPKPKK